MANYLMPNEENMNISEKRFIFAIRNRMIPIESNFPIKHQNKQEKIWRNNKHETYINM